MNLEERAIERILDEEPELKRTPANNPGFDLTEVDPNGRPVRWIEVKAMKATLNDRPVGISRTQFEWAQKHGSGFWLYIVENAGTPEQGPSCENTRPSRQVANLHLRPRLALGDRSHRINWLRGNNKCRI